MSGFKKRLIEHLDRCGLVLNDLKSLPGLRAKYAGKAFHSTFTNWKGKRDISKEDQLLIAADLDLPPAWVADGTGEAPDPRHTLALVHHHRHGAPLPASRTPQPPTIRPRRDDNEPPQPDFNAREVTESEWAILEGLRVMPEEEIDALRQKAAQAKAHYERLKEQFQGKAIHDGAGAPSDPQKRGRK